MKTYELTVSTPDGILFHDQAEMLTVRGAEGDLAIMAGHIPLMTATRPCIMKIHKADGTAVSCKTEGGMLAVSENSVRFLTDCCTFDSAGN